MHRLADRGVRQPVAPPAEAAARADELTAALRAGFGTRLRCDVTALPSGAVDATVRNGTSIAAVQISPAGDEWGVSVDWDDSEAMTGHDHVVSAVDDVVAVLRTYWPG